MNPQSYDDHFQLDQIKQKNIVNLFDNLNIKQDDCNDSSSTDEVDSDELQHILKQCNDKIGVINSIIQFPELVDIIPISLKRKLVLLSQCKLSSPEEYLKACRLAISIGYRAVNKFLFKNTDPRQKGPTLWKALRSKGCQFIGPVIQEEILRLVLLALEDGHPLSRQVLIMFVMQKLLSHFPSQSKTGIGRVIQTLYRASCFEVIKREDGSSLLQLKPEFRTYEALRREHDSQIVSIGNEVGLLFSPVQWSNMLYGEFGFKPYMQSIIDKLNATNPSFGKLINKLRSVLNDSNDPMRIVGTLSHFEHLSALEIKINKTNKCSLQDVSITIDAVNFIMNKLITFLRYLKQQQYQIQSSS